MVGAGWCCSLQEIIAAAEVGGGIACVLSGAYGYRSSAGVQTSYRVPLVTGARGVYDLPAVCLSLQAPGGYTILLPCASRYRRPGGILPSFRVPIVTGARGV
mgnify:CR=1 FL=1